MNVTSTAETMDIPGYGGVYYIDREARIWKRRNGCEDRLLYGSLYPNGGRAYRLTNAYGEQKAWFMRRLVWMTWLAEFPKDWILLHRNGVRSDWRMENLEIMSPEEFHALRKPAKEGCHRRRRVLKVDPETGETLAVYATAKQAAQANWMCAASVLGSIYGEGKKRPGIAPDGYRYRWEE